ncbi:MAG: TonB-dependent receptor [Bradyrhizobium sp.]|nr:TonB-dependent receptor [Bradyrhizobium sp.]
MRGAVTKLRISLVCGAALAALTPQLASAQSRAVVHVGVQSLEQSLKDVARQTGTNILFTSAAVQGISGRAIDGTMSAEEAVKRLIAGTRLQVVRDGNGGLIVRQAARNFTERAPQASQSVGDAQLSAGETRSAGNAVDDGDAQAGVGSRDIVVTGTLLHGKTPPADLSVYTRARIEQTGATTLEQFSRKLPQNLSDNTQEGAGGSANTAGITSAGGSSFTKGSSFNLRGLGAGSTLTLINGRRTAGSGQGGAFVDISLIPLAAVDRVEILSDGASALYGSDAIGGVVNIILRSDFSGAQSSARYGTATEGGGDEFVASQLLGASWNSGNLFGVFEHRGVQGIRSTQRSYIPQSIDYLITPGEDANKAFASFRQALGSSVTLSADASFGDRHTSSDFLNGSGLVYSITQKLAARDYGGDISLAADLGHDWNASVTGTLSQNTENYNSRLNYPAFNLNTPSTASTRNSLLTVNAKLDGSLIELPGGSLKSALYAEYTDEKYLTFNTTSNGKSSAPDALITRHIASIAGEIFIPIVGSSNATPGIRRLELSLSGRYDHYSDFGSTANPHVGLLWAPFEGLSFRGTWSTAFHAPVLGLLNSKPFYNVTAIPDPASATGFTNTLLDLSTGTSALKPETARIFTIGMDISPSLLKGVTFKINYYNISYKGKIAAPPFPGGDDFSIYQPNAANLQFLVTRNPSLALVNSYYNCTQCKFFNFSNIPASGVQAILDERQRNLAATQQSGMDASVSYELPYRRGKFLLSLAGTYIFDNSYKFLPASPSVDILNRIALPVDLRVVGAVGWMQGAWAANINLNYFNGYNDDNLAPYGRISAWATMDFSLALTLKGQGVPAILRNTTLSFSAENLMDSHPPYVQAASGAAGINTLTYDATNASAVGRRVSIQWTKKW